VPLPLGNAPGFLPKIVPASGRKVNHRKPGQRLLSEPVRIVRDLTLMFEIRNKFAVQVAGASICVRTRAITRQVAGSAFIRDRDWFPQGRLTWRQRSRSSS
jgi:hypothetical protein